MEVDISDHCHSYKGYGKGVINKHGDKDRNEFYNVCALFFNIHFLSLYTSDRRKCRVLRPLALKHFESNQDGESGRAYTRTLPRCSGA